MTLSRSNRILPTRQREIEALASTINARDLGKFSARYMEEEVLLYMAQGQAFCIPGGFRNDAEFLSLFAQNLSDIRAGWGAR